jgi:hypothetical protein
MVDNFTFAILVTLNELERRHGLEPCDFVASLDIRSEPTSALRFEAPPPPEKSAAFAQMLADLGVSPDANANQLVGTEQELWQALQGALANAPRMPRGRG